METTIQISKELLEELKKRKISSKESYEDVIRDLLEDTLALSDETKKAIAQGRQQIHQGKTVSFEELKRELQ